MRNLICVFLICLIFFSFCKKDEKNDDLKIEILNNEILSRGDISEKDIKNVLFYDNYIYDSIPVNKINMKITNTGTKKYVFFIGKEFDYIEKLKPESISFNVFTEKEIFKPTYISAAINFTKDNFHYKKFINEIRRDSLKKELNEKYLKEKTSIEKIEFQNNMSYIVIHPGESKFFSYYKTLPIFNDYFNLHYIYKFNSNEKYYFQISLKNNEEISRKNFTINQYNEITTNGYTIFNGVINSNRVPIKFINMNKK